MRDEAADDGCGAGRGDGGDEGTAEMDRRVSLAIHSAEWIAQWASGEFAKDDDVGRRRLSTCLVRVVHPSEALLASLTRLDRTRGSGDRRQLLLRSPLLGEAMIVHRWALAVTNVLREQLGSEARFVATILLV